MKALKIIIIALAAQGEGISGGDRIFIEFARRWHKNAEIEIVVTEEGKRMCERQNLKGRNIKFIKLNALNYFARIFAGIVYGLRSEISREKTIVYSASEFWMDSLPALILKLRSKKVKWAASWYQTAPNPITGFSEKKRENVYRLNAFYYWFMQLPIKPLVVNYADLMLVNNNDEYEKYKKVKKRGSVEIVLGAVDTVGIKNWISKHKKNKKSYDAVFQGRFHPQKGVVEMIEIWGDVVKQIPTAKLAMIGDGPLMAEVKEKIVKLNLKDNIKLLGYMFDGDEKYSVFSSSRIVVHPALYDSGGMASAEAMAFGLPCVGFDLKAYKSYYPKGMVKVKNKQEFSNTIVKLLNEKNTRKRVGQEAIKLINESYSWDERAMVVYDRITKL